MRFAMFRRREALRVESVAGIPLHGLERNADGVLLHLAIENHDPLVLEVPRHLAPEMRDYLRKIVEALDHWDKIARVKEQSTPRPVRPLAEFRYRDGEPVHWDRHWDWKFGA